MYVGALAEDQVIRPMHQTTDRGERFSTGDR
jgi:hypothetical protein